MQKKQVRVRVDDNLYYHLKTYCDSFDYPMAYVVRRAVKKFLKEKGVIK